MLSKSERERSAIVSSAVSYLEPFDDPIMAANVSGHDFSLLDLICFRTMKTPIIAINE